MPRIDDIFSGLRANHTKGLMPFICGGFPSCEATTSLIPSLGQAGACITEIGIPFSDPIADGPVIASAMHEALQRGVEVDDVLNAVAQARNSTDMGLVAMVSASIVHRRGDSAFLEALAQKGLDGVIIPDLDPQQAPPLLTAADQHGLSFSLLIAPTTPEHRIEALVQSCRGFIYLLARGGLTGATDSLPDLEDRVATIRQFTDLPIAAGFGIGSAHQVRAATEACDAAIVGSALIKEMAGADDPLLAAASFVESLAEGLA